MARRFALAALVTLVVATAAGPARADLLEITGFTPASGPIGSTVVISGGGTSRVNAAAIAGSKVYVSSFRLGTRRLYAIETAAGPPLQLWSVSGSGTSSTSFAQTPSAVIGGNGLVYAAIGSDVYAFDPASANPATPRWHHDLPADAISLTVGEGVLYVSAKDARLYALASAP